MIKKIIFIAITFLFLNSCGYHPIFSSSESFFAINKLELIEKNNINSTIKKSLKIYRTNENAKIFYDLKISSKISKTILSKDSKGDPKLFLSNISVQIDVIENNITKNTKTFNKSESYNNNSNKFELKKTKNNIESNLTNKIIEEIIIYLHSI